MRAKITVFIVLMILGAEFVLQAQDPQFTQYYASPVYMNPAFAGTTQQHRVTSNYRAQWASLPQAYVTHSLAYDINLKESNSNFGLMFTTDKAGSAGLRSTGVHGVYSYSIPLNNGFMIVPGLQFGYLYQSLDFNSLVFRDQLLFGDGNAPTVDPVSTQFENTGLFDFSTGLLLYNKRSWAGFAIHHLNEPNHSFLNEESHLPMRLSMHAGIKIPLKGNVLKGSVKQSVSPSFNYHRQGRFDQLDVGLNYQYDYISFGMWYKGIPVQQDMEDHINHDALAFILGLHVRGMDFGYSYDLTVSRLSPTGSGGSHELSLVIQFLYPRNPNRVTRKDKYTPCPAFHINNLWKP